MGFLLSIFLLILYKSNIKEMRDFLKERLKEVGPQEELGQENVIQDYEHRILNALDGYYDDEADLDNMITALERVKDNAILTKLSIPS